MRDEEYRAAPFGESGEDVLGDERAFGVETDDGFIDKQKFWFMEQSGKNAEFLLVST